MRASEALAHVPVVIVSAWPRDAAQLEGRMQGFIKKPIELQTLLDTVALFCGPRAA
jgi:DNA-binding response OmpR family regulator